MQIHCNHHKMLTEYSTSHVNAILIGCEVGFSISGVQFCLRHLPQPQNKKGNPRKQIYCRKLNEKRQQQFKTGWLS